MEQLAIEYKINLDFQYPHLTEFSLKKSFTMDFDDLRNFFQLNPQLRKVSLPFFRNATFLSRLNEILPNLESLEIFACQDRKGFEGFQTVRFKNLKKIALTVFTYNDDWTDELQRMLTSIEFERLDSIDIVTYYKNRNWINFLIDWIGSNTDLTKLSFIFKELNDQLLTTLITPLQQLKVLTITWDDQSTLDELNRILSNNVLMNSLITQINISIPKYNYLNRTLVCESIPNGWQFTGMREVGRPFEMCDVIELYRIFEI